MQRVRTGYRWRKLFRAYAFLQAFPAFVVFFNVSIYAFVMLYALTVDKYKKFARNRIRSLQVFAVLFGIGAFISVINMPEGINNKNFLFAIRYLPNYFYWCFLVIFFVRYRDLIDYPIVNKAIFWGTLLIIPYFFIREAFLQGLPFFLKTSYNSFAFLMVCFAAIAVAYVKKSKGILWALLFFGLILAVLLFLERRAGFVLVTLGGMLVLFVDRITSRAYFAVIFLVAFLGLFLALPATENLLQSASPRIHQLIYNIEEVQSQDRSYLSRRAMIEKGLNFFEERPLTGIGLFNFSRMEGKIDGNFEGAKYVVHKKINNLSAHNSYIVVLSEGGLILSIPFVLLHLRIIWFILISHQKIRSEMLPYFVGYVSMLFHFSTISALVNVYGWFLVALVASAIYRIK